MILNEDLFEALNEEVVIKPTDNSYHDVWYLDDRYAVHNDGGKFHVIDRANGNNYLLNSDSIDEVNDYIKNTLNLDMSIEPSSRQFKKKANIDADKDRYLRDAAKMDWESGHPYDPDDFSYFKRVCKEDGYNVNKEDFQKYWEYFDEIRSEANSQYDDNHAKEWSERHPYGYYNDESDYSIDVADDIDLGDWEEMDSKQVKDSDGFMTDYTWYIKYNNDDGSETHVMIFGDQDLYTPLNSEPDAEFDSEQAAQEWFDNYYGFVDDEEELKDEDVVINESSWAENNYTWGKARQPKIDAIFEAGLWEEFEDAVLEASDIVVGLHTDIYHIQNNAARTEPPYITDADIKEAKKLIFKLCDEYYEKAIAKNDELEESLTESWATLVKDSINHLVNDLGKDPDAEDFADDVINDIENNYDVDIDFSNPLKYKDWASEIACEVSRQLNESLDSEDEVYNGYVVRKSDTSDNYFVYDNNGHVEDDDHKGQGYPTKEAAIERANSLEKGIAKSNSDLEEAIKPNIESEELKALAQKHNIKILDAMSNGDLRMEGAGADLMKFYQEAEKLGLWEVDSTLYEKIEGFDQISEFTSLAKKLGFKTLRQMRAVMEIAHNLGKSELEFVQYLDKEFNGKVPEELIDGLTEEVVDIGTVLGIFDNDMYQKFDKTERKPGETITVAMRRAYDELLDLSKKLDIGELNITTNPAYKEFYLQEKRPDENVLDAMRRYYKELIDSGFDPDNLNESIELAEEAMLNINKSEALDAIANAKQYIKENNFAAAKDTLLYAAKIVSTPITEGAVKDLMIEVEEDGGLDSWKTKMLKELADMEDSLSYMKNYAPKEINAGGMFDSAEDLNKSINELENAISQVKAKIDIMTK